MAKVMVGKTSDIGEGKMTHLTVGGKEILIANVGGQYYATGNTCSHAGAELHEGELNGKELICPWHGAKWDVTTGNAWFLSAGAWWGASAGILIANGRHVLPFNERYAWGAGGGLIARARSVWMSAALSARE